MRLLLLGIAFVLVVTACGSGSHASQAANLSAQLATTRHLTTADNERAAKRSAEMQLGRVVLPSGAVRLRAEPAGDGGLLTHLIGKTAIDPHRYWRVHAPFYSVLTFVKTHPPIGSHQYGWGRLGLHRASRFYTFAFPPIKGRVAGRELDVSLVKLPQGWTGVRADGLAGWVVERSAADRVPGGVHEVDVRAPDFVSRVTNAAKVRTIVRWFNALPVSRSGGKCVVPRPPYVRLAFRSAGGAPLARAAVPEMYPGCLGITLTIRGRQVEHYIGDQIRFLRHLHQLLGLRLRVLRPR